MAWEMMDPDDCGLFAHCLAATEIIIYIGDRDYTVCDGAVILGNFTELQEAMKFAEDYDTRWCTENLNTEWVNPNTGSARVR